MPERIKVQFRPSLIIFVGEAGKRIRDYLSHDMLLANLDTPLQQSVGLLEITTEGENADPYHADPFPAGEQFPEDEDAPKKGGPLEALIEASLRSVQLDRRRLAISSEDYSVPNPRTQVYIVGDITDWTWMPSVLRTVREQVRKNRFDTLVCYFLNCNQPQDDHSKTLDGKLLEGKPVEGIANKWGDFELANFCYLYEHMMTYPFPTFINQAEGRYAAAEALFALIATGISPSPLFEDAMRLRPNLESYSDYVGSLSTSMITFPRTWMRRYCGYQLCSDLMQKWYEDLDKGGISDEERERQQRKAHKAVDEIAFWLKDDPPRPYVDESKWPSLSILRQKNHPESERVLYKQMDLYRQLVDQTKGLFSLFSNESVTQEYKKRRSKSDTWANIVYERSGKAVDLFTKWNTAATYAWQAASLRICGEVKQTVDQLWPNSDKGFELARTYIDEFDNRLARLADRLRSWSKSHYNEYEKDIEHFQQLASGNWAIPENEPNIAGVEGLTGVGQARPTMGGRGPTSGAGNSFATTSASSADRPTVILNAPPPQAGPQHLPPREEEIALKLEQRSTWKQKNVPSLATLCTVGFLFWLSMILIASTLMLRTDILLVVAAAIALFTFAGNWLFRIQRQREVTAAREDLLRFYRRYYTYSCEKREDLLRLDVMRPLRGKVMNMRIQLDDIDSFICELRDVARRDAVQVRNDLFDGPAGVRDIFIGSGERLQKQGKHTLESFATQITQLRLNYPLQEWHRNLDDMKSELIRMFRDSSESFIEMSEKDAQQQIYKFTLDVVDGYLTGSLVDISTALDKAEIWREVLDRVKKPLYYAQMGIREPHLLFVCGNDMDLMRSKVHIPSDALTVETKNREWLLVVAFFRGGTPTALNAEKLFPYKSANPDSQNTEESKKEEEADSIDRRE